MTGATSNDGSEASDLTDEDDVREIMGRLDEAHAAGIPVWIECAGWKRNSALNWAHLRAGDPL